MSSFTHGNVVVIYISYSHWDRGIYLWKSPDAIGELFDNLLICLKWSWVQEFSLGHNHCPLRLTNCPENRDKVQGYITTNPRLDHSILQMTTWFPVKLMSTPWLDKRNKKQWGKSNSNWLLPDTFGNMGQGLKSFKIRYSRSSLPAVSANWFDNQVLEDEQFTSQFSWDTGKGLMKPCTCILFANWYSNGNEIPW